MSEEALAVEPQVDPQPEPEVAAETQQPEGEPTEKPKVPPEVQESIDKRIGKSIAAQREAERAAQEAQRRAEAAEAKLAEVSKPVRPDIPPPPDPYSDSFAEEIAARDKAIQDAAAYDAQQNLIKQQQQEAEQAKTKAAQDKFVETVTSYTERAEKLGVERAELQKAGELVTPLLQPAVVNFILEQEQGPNITTYLANNPQELESIRHMAPLQAAAHIAANVVSKASAKEPPTLAPDPVDNPNGAGFPEGQRGPKGATYE